MNRLIFIVLLPVIITACSSKPIVLTHYLLHQPMPESTPVNADIYSRTPILLRSITTPDYLKHRNLSIQTSNNTLHFASQHVWAEPFANSFVFALTSELTEHHNLHLERNEAWITNPQNTAILDIRLQDFIPTYNGNVIATGDFRLELGQGGEVLMRRFHFSLPIEQDGFSHSVATMRKLISQLANEIDSTLKSE